MSTETTDRAAEFEEIFAHRIDRESRNDERSGWTMYRATKSARTLMKFVDRAKRDGFASAFARDGKIGVRTNDLTT